MSELNSASVNVLLADDHSLIRQGIVFLLEEMDWECEIFQASSLQQLMNSIQEHPIDIAIIDAHFPDGNSITIVPEIKKISPKTKILIFTGIEESTHSLKFLNAGADGFLSKLNEEEEIAEAIKKMYTHGSYISEVTQALLRNSISNPTLINPLLSLTERELQIAEMYAEGLGNLEIANRLDVKQNTVSTIKKRIFDKLKIENIVELIDLMKKHY
ncbi:response regulator transcription factor [Chryseobacterium sp. PS-8]|uniref:Response regulator transcription factor n=1 Tax=Chryseobacterium indicum TaxID=2766954 RepID=A0ABS9C747_9FLAO|nr:response regulator transcription factor [Chryseobacterium sp. PS-8]MCF2220103.1 response regulator transcription factor [Chryseobacterium sp. PS-8]